MKSSFKNFINPLFSQLSMEGIINNFRRGVRTVYSNQMIVTVNGVDTKEKANKLLTKKITWISLGKLKKQITGTVTKAHGNSGALRVKFEKGMPGQAIGAKVKVE